MTNEENGCRGIWMLRRRWIIPIFLVSLLASACSSESEGDIPSVLATQAPAIQPTEAVQTPAPGSTGPAQGLTSNQQELADSIFQVLMEDDERPSSIAEDQIRCLADGLAGVFADERLAELGLDGPSFTGANEAEWNLGLFDDFGISEGEHSAMVDRAMECADWRAMLAQQIAGEGLSPDQANCIASEISDEGLRTQVMIGLVSEFEDEMEGAEEAFRAIRTCVDIRESLYESYVQEGLSEESARCVADGLPDEFIEMMTGGQEPEDEDAAAALFGEMVQLQFRCLTPEEIEMMGGSGLDPGGPIGAGACPPDDGSGPQVLDFDDPQPMCLDPWREYTAVFDTTAGELRITLDMAGTPITANNFAVLARYHYYDDTLLFRTDPSIGIIQGGSPHTNSPSDPGPGYTIPDEGTGFTYEPGQIVMARTAAPNSAGAQFFFAVNEQTARLNSQGTYVVFGQMDEESLAVAEAILASHVDQPDNPLGGGPEPPVVVNSVTIEETG